MFYLLDLYNFFIDLKLLFMLCNLVRSIFNFSFYVYIYIMYKSIKNSYYWYGAD